MKLTSRSSGQLFQSDSLQDLQHVANLIANEAHTLAFDPDYMSPFAVGAAANGFDVKGEFVDRAVEGFFLRPTPSFVKNYIILFTMSCHVIHSFIVFVTELIEV